MSVQLQWGKRLFPPQHISDHVLYIRKQLTRAIRKKYIYIFFSALYLLIWNIDFANLASQCVLHNIFVLQVKTRYMLQTCHRENERKEVKFVKQTFLGWSLTTLMASFLRLSLGRRCRRTTKSMEGPTSTNSVLGTTVPDFFSRSAHCVRITLFADIAEHRYTRSNPARFSFSTTCIYHIHGRNYISLHSEVKLYTMVD